MSIRDQQNTLPHQTLNENQKLLIGLLLMFMALGFIVFTVMKMSDIQDENRKNLTSISELLMSIGELKEEISQKENKSDKLKVEIDSLDAEMKKLNLKNEESDISKILSKKSNQEEVYRKDEIDQKFEKLEYALYNDDCPDIKGNWLVTKKGLDGFYIPQFNIELKQLKCQINIDFNMSNIQHNIEGYYIGNKTFSAKMTRYDQRNCTAIFKIKYVVNDTNTKIKADNKIDSTENCGLGQNFAEDLILEKSN